MGVADSMGPLSDAVKDKFQLSRAMATLMPFFVFIAFAICSLPGGMLAARIGKKNVLLLGLLLAAVAVAIPSFMDPGFGLLLACIFVLGVGTTFLQVAGNPIMRDVSAEGDYSRNLALAQGIKGVGSAASAYIVTAIAGIAVFAKMGWRGSFPLFFVLMALGFFLVLIMRIKETKADNPPGLGGTLSLLTIPVFALAVLGIFLYVGAEVCLGTFLKPALQGFFVAANVAPENLKEATEKAGKSAAFFGPALFFLIITAGRLLVGSVKANPRAIFRVSALMGLVGAAMLLTGNKYLSLAAVVVCGLGFANIWPMLFSITVEEKPERASELSGLMCMAISGGAIVPLIMGKLIDLNMSQAMAFIVPTVCFAYLFLLSLKGGKKAPAPAK